MKARTCRQVVVVVVVVVFFSLLLSLLLPVLLLCFFEDQVRCVGGAAKNDGRKHSNGVGRKDGTGREGS